MFIIYSSDSEVLVTDPAHEPDMLRIWFREGGRDTEDYDREVVNDECVNVSSRLRVSTG